MLCYEVIHLFVHAITRHQANQYRSNIQDGAPAKGKRISPTVHGRTLENALNGALC